MRLSKVVFRFIDPNTTRNTILSYYTPGIIIKFLLDILGSIFEVYIDSAPKK